MATPQPIGSTLLHWLAARYPASKRQTLRRMLQAGRVTINGRPARKANQPLAPDDRVEVLPAAARPAAPAPRRFRIVYEDADVLVVDKPPGLLTSTTPREPRPTLLAAVRDYLESTGPARGRRVRLGLIHRLDRDASGLLVFSKTHDAYLSLKHQFFEHTVERVYTAVVQGVPNPAKGRIESRLVERADGTVYSTRRPGEGEPAVTDYEVVETRGGRSLVRVTLHTGRKHQIRAHLSERDTPIVGDTMYGGRDVAKASGKVTTNQPPPRRLMLAATQLSFAHPRSGQRLTFKRPMPAAFAAAFAPAAAGGSR